MQTLIKNGANLNTQGGQYGNTLQATLLGGYISIAQALIENGANINA